jgi:hypothetical protein
MTGPKSEFDKQNNGYLAMITEKVMEYLGQLKSAPKVGSPDEVVIDDHQSDDNTTFVQFTVNTDNGRPYTDVTHFKNENL